jgi:hypothetical protein
MPYDLGWLAKPSTFLGVGKANKKNAEIYFRRSASPWLLFGENDLFSMRKEERSVG